MDPPAGGFASISSSSALLVQVSADPSQARPAHTVARLVLMGADDWSSNVVLRLRDKYFRLQRCEFGSGHGWAGFLCRLPANTAPGIGWVKVVSSEFPTEHAFPILLTDDSDLCLELNRVLPQHYEFAESAHSFLVGFGEAMFASPHQPWPSDQLARIVLEAVSLGADRALRLLLAAALQLSPEYPRTLLLIADTTTPEGLLSAAVLSGSTEITNTVIFCMAMNGLALNPCRRSSDGHGFSALHWAALQGNHGLIYSLLCEVDDPVRQWNTLEARNSGGTPAQLMAAVDSSFSLEALLEESYSDMSSESRSSEDFSTGATSAFTEEGALRPTEAVQDEEEDSRVASGRHQELMGEALVDALGCRSMHHQIGFLGLYTFLVWALGCTDPLAWVTLCVLIPTLHMLLPYAHRHYYVQSLGESRKLLERVGLSMSPAMVILEPAGRTAFDSYVMKRTTLGFFFDNLLMVLFLAVFSLSPALGAYKQSGTVSPWLVAPFLLGVGVLVPARMWASATARRRARQWATVATNVYCFLAVYVHVFYDQLANTGQCALPGSAVDDTSVPALLRRAVIGTAGIGLARAALVETSLPVALVYEVLMIVAWSIIGIPARMRCLEILTGVKQSGAWWAVTAALWLVSSVLVTSHGIVTERKRLETFLQNNKAICQ